MVSIIEYEDIEVLLNDLDYWCNSVGELHHHGERSVEEHDLPEELQKAYNTLWSDSTGSLCYLVEYKGDYGIALINEFDKDFAESVATTMDDLYARMKDKAFSFESMEEFQNATILLGKYSGCDECHELITILPTDTEKDLFNKIAELLYQNVYKV